MSKTKFVMAGALLAGTALVAPKPALATLMLSVAVGANTIQCIDNQATATCTDTNPNIGTLAVANGTSVGGVVINGSLSTSSGTTVTAGAFAILNTGSLSIINTNNVTTHVDAAVGDINFVGPVDTFNTSTAGTFQTAKGSSITTTFYNDPTNHQGAETATDSAGVVIDTFSFNALLLADAYAHTNTGAVTDSDLFSMTETMSLNLTAGGQLINRGSTEIKDLVAVPEPASLGILGTALASFGWYVRRRRKNSDTMDNTITA